MATMAEHSQDEFQEEVEGEEPNQFSADSHRHAKINLKALNSGDGSSGRGRDLTPIVF